MYKLTSLALAALPLVTLAGTAEEEPAIPSCSEPYATIALREPSSGGGWWDSYDLENPQALIKFYVNESGCFTLVDRASGLEMGMSERDLAQSGELQMNSNVGTGQLLAADFFLIPDLITNDEDRGGKRFGGILGGKLGGSIGGILGDVKTKNMEADTILTLVDARTGVQTATARGQAKKRDLSFDVGGLLGAAGGVSSYQDTQIGRVIATAYAEAYTELVAKVQASSGGLTDTAAPTQSYVIAFDTEMYTRPERTDTVRSLREGMQVYPTGPRNGAFMEVKDKFGTLGWVSVEDLL